MDGDAPTKADLGAGLGADSGRRLSTAVVLFHETLGQCLGLSAVDHRALTLILDHAPLTAGTLAQLTGLTPGAVTGLADRLERAGYIRRTPDPSDRRKIVIEPIGDGMPGLDEVFVDLGTAMSTFMAKYDDRELATIADYVDNTIDVLQEQTRRLSEELTGSARGAALRDPHPPLGD
jgi:DNA-binding MarR family transcriptional regulator